MKIEFKKWFDIWRIDYIFRTILSSTASTFLGVVFALYNGALGILHGSVWNGTICVYYMLLVIIRWILLKNYKSIKNKTQKKSFNKKLIMAHVLLFIMNISMIAPIAFMIKGERSYSLGLIPAIAMAAYTTYRITLASINFRKSSKTKNSIIRFLRTLNLAESLMAVLTLQNALILVNSASYSIEMIILSAISSAAIIVIIIIASIFSLLFSLKNPVIINDDDV